MRKIGRAREYGYAIQRGVSGIHGVDRPREATGAQVAPDGGADAADTVG